MSDEFPFKIHDIAGAQSGPRLLITGGVHGDEFTPMAAIRQLSRQVDPALLSGNLTLIPIVNEAAFLDGARVAGDGLDLARICPGRESGSVSERVAHSLSGLIRAADFYIDLHTGSYDSSIFPLTGYVLHDDEDVLDAQRRMARAFNLPVVWGTDPSLDGRTLSVARDSNVPSIYAEYLGSGMCDPAGVADYVQGCLNVMKDLEMIEQPLQAARVRHLVEDRRVGSGHMQVQNLSPVTGFFEAAVSLGDPVVVGDLLGTVVGYDDGETRSVLAVEAGMVIGLRTFSRVTKGDFVAVIMPNASDK